MIEIVNANVIVTLILVIAIFALMVKVIKCGNCIYYVLQKCVVVNVRQNIKLITV
jgi:hypothetical protein